MEEEEEMRGVSPDDMARRSLRRPWTCVEGTAGVGDSPRLGWRSASRLLICMAMIETTLLVNDDFEVRCIETCNINSMLLHISYIVITHFAGRT